VMMGSLTLEELHLFLADQKLVERIDLTEFELDKKLVKRLGAACCVVHRIVPIEIYHFAEGEILRFAVQSVDHIAAVKRSRILCNFVLIPYLASPEQFAPLFEAVTELSRQG